MPLDKIVLTRSQCFVREYDHRKVTIIGGIELVVNAKPDDMKQREAEIIETQIIRFGSNASKEFNGYILHGGSLAMRSNAPHLHQGMAEYNFSLVRYHVEY